VQRPELEPADECVEVHHGQVPRGACEDSVPDAQAAFPSGAPWTSTPFTGPVIALAAHVSSKPQARVPASTTGSRVHSAPCVASSRSIRATDP